MSCSARLCMRGRFAARATRSCPRRTAAHCDSSSGVRTEALRSDGDAGSGASAQVPVGAEPLGAVGAHRLDDRDERAALLGQRVLDARRDLGERPARRRCPPPRARAGAARACAARCPRASARARRSATGPRRDRGSRAASTCRRRCRRCGRRGSRSSARDVILSQHFTNESGRAGSVAGMPALPDVLVCGVGGALGEAWMRGLLNGMADGAGLDFRRCEHFVGSSAGSIVTAVLAAGRASRRRRARRRGVGRGRRRGAGRPGPRLDRSRARRPVPPVAPAPPC